MPNLALILRHGLYCKNNCPINPTLFFSIGNDEIIGRRSRAIVKCYPETVVNDYVPFYFSIRTPMLYNINTGWNVPKYPQHNIIYLCFKLTDLTTDEFQWCYTNGNAAVEISKFFTDLNQIEQNIDWNSIQTTDFAGKRDTTRKKHAEFLVRNHVPSQLIKKIVVMTEHKKIEVENILHKENIVIPVAVNSKYYF